MLHDPTVRDSRTRHVTLLCQLLCHTIALQYQYESLYTNWIHDETTSSDTCPGGQMFIGHRAY